jgi:hypothetical protein
MLIPGARLTQHARFEGVSRLIEANVIDGLTLLVLSVTWKKLGT